MLLVPFALAQELPWECAPIATPADARPYVDAVRDESTGVEEAGEAALAMAEAWVDASCLTDCSDSAATTCSSGACVTAAGAWVEVEDTLSDTSDGTLRSSSGATVIVVEPPASAGTTWTRLEVTKTWGRRRESAGTIMPSSSWAAWDVSWEGTLDAAWVADGGFTATLSERTYTSTSREASWDDGTCAWSVDDVDAATVGGTEVAVSYSWDRCGGYFMTSGDATIDGVAYGVVDPNTWEDATDADDDGNNDGYWDCDDTDPTAYYCAAEVPYDGVDQDCDGVDAGGPDEDTGEAGDTGEAEDTGGDGDTGDTAADTDDTGDTAADTDDTGDTAADTDDTGDTAADTDDTGDTAAVTDTNDTGSGAEAPDAPEHGDEAGCATAPASPWLGFAALLALPLRRRARR